MARGRVVVTGLGAVSCFGAGVDRFWTGLTEERTGRQGVRSFDGSKYRSAQAAEVPWDSLPALEGGEGGRPMEKASLLASVAADEAAGDARLSADDARAAGCVLGTLCSGAQVFEEYGRLFNALPATSPDAFPDVDECMVGYQLETLVDRFGLEGPCTLVSTACSSSTDAIGYAADFIRAGDAEVMFAGGADILSEVVHAGFNSVFSITLDRPRPFDSERTGFVIGEGAGIVILESLEHARRRGARIYAELLGYGLSNAAFHLTATSEDGSGELLAVKRCLDDAGVSASQVSYVNLHGTATSHNDATEVRVLHDLFGDRVSEVAVSSIKPNIGHCMGAAGALEAIATIKCMERGFVPGMLDTRGDIDPTLSFVLQGGRKLHVEYALSQSFGFGGACSALLLGEAAPDRIDAPRSAAALDGELR